MREDDYIFTKWDFDTMIHKPSQHKQKGQPILDLESPAI